jgi:hypothetical protein
MDPWKWRKSKCREIVLAKCTLLGCVIERGHYTNMIYAPPRYCFRWSGKSFLAASNFNGWPALLKALDKGLQPREP